MPSSDSVSIGQRRCVRPRLADTSAVKPVSTTMVRSALADHPGEVVHRHRPVVRVAADEMVRAPGVAPGVADGEDLVFSHRVSHCRPSPRPQSFSASTAIFTPARSCCSSIGERESRSAQPRFSASVISSSVRLQSAHRHADLACRARRPATRPCGRSAARRRAGRRCRAGTGRSARRRCAGGPARPGAPPPTASSGSTPALTPMVKTSASAGCIA